MPLQQLKSLIARGELRRDPPQLAAAERLERLARELEAWRPSPQAEASGGMFGLFGRSR